MTATPAIAVSGLVKTFGPTRALDGLDLTVDTGDVHGFLGPNGAGKTTTLRVLLGLLRADAGEARLLGGDPWRDATALPRRPGWSGCRASTTSRSPAPGCAARSTPTTSTRCCASSPRWGCAAWSASHRPLRSCSCATTRPSSRPATAGAAPARRCRDERAGRHPQPDPADPAARPLPAAALDRGAGPPPDPDGGSPRPVLFHPGGTPGALRDDREHPRAARHARAGVRRHPRGAHHLAGGAGLHDRGPGEPAHRHPAHPRRRGGATARA